MSSLLSSGMLMCVICERLFVRTYALMYTKGKALTLARKFLLENSESQGFF